MPNLEEHCKHTFERYDVEGRDIHQWLDEPSRKYAGRHREFRHDSETVKLAGDLFGKKYGRTLAENIVLDHIMLDHKEEIQRRDEKSKVTESETISIDKTWRISFWIIFFAFGIPTWYVCYLLAIHSEIERQVSIIILILFFLVFGIIWLIASSFQINQRRTHVDDLNLKTVQMSSTSMKSL
jgi:hypothetical protein